MAFQESITLESDAKRYTNGGNDLGLDPDGLAALRGAIAAWRAGPVVDAERRVPPRAKSFTTWSGLDVPDLVTPADTPRDYA